MNLVRSFYFRREVISPSITSLSLLITKSSELSSTHFAILPLYISKEDVSKLAEAKSSYVNFTFRESLDVGVLDSFGPISLMIDLPTCFRLDLGLDAPRLLGDS
jgi:hypothetical protein